MMTYDNSVCHRIQKILCQIPLHPYFKIGKDTQGNKPLTQYSPAQQGTKLKLPSLLQI